MTVSDRCRATSKDGSPCSAKPLPDREWCHWHDPDRDELREESRQRGRPQQLPRSQIRKLLAKGLESLGDVQMVLMVALMEVQAGKLEPKVAHAMANLAGRIKDLQIGVDLEEQAADLQRRLSELSERVG